jgi:hypothetical protein
MAMAINLSRYTTEELFQEETLVFNYLYLMQKNDELTERLSEINTRLNIVSGEEYRKLSRESLRIQNDCKANFAEMNSINMQLLLLHEK